MKKQPNPKAEITFLKSGEVTWTSKSGKNSARTFIRKGTKMTLRIEMTNGGNLELWDGSWSIIMSPEKVKVEPVTKAKAG